MWTVNASDVEWVKCEHINKTGSIVQLEAQIHQVRCKLDTLQKKKQTNIHQLESSLENLTNKLSKEMNDCKLKLERHSFTSKVSVKTFDASNKQKEFQCKMTQIPANTYNASTGHKLQGMSKDAIIVTSWPTGFKTGSMLSYPVYAHHQDYT